jgi:hypothetical protein
LAGNQGKYSLQGPLSNQEQLAMGKETGMSKATGWIPDDPDPKDFTLNNNEIPKLLFQSQAIQKLTTIVEKISTALEEYPLLNAFLDDETKRVIEEIQRLNVEASNSFLNLVSARCLTPEKSGGPQLQLEALEALSQDQSISQDPTPNISSVNTSSADIVYMPILGSYKQFSEKKLLCLQPTHQLDKFYSSRVEDQMALNLQSCTAHAGVALMECFEMLRHHSKSSAKTGDGTTLSNNDDKLSSRFLYKVTRFLSKRPAGDTGASIRDTLKAMLLFGVPPEYFWIGRLPTPARPLTTGMRSLRHFVMPMPKTTKP